MNCARAALTSLLGTLALGTMAQDRLRPSINQEFWASATVIGRPMFLQALLPKSIVRRLRISTELGYRSADSFFAGRQVYGDVGIGYKLNDHITLGGEFRYAYRGDDADRQRACAMFEYKTELARLELGYRFDYQHNFREFGGQREIFRNKFIAGYNIPKFKFDPKFSVEFFQWAGYQGLIYFGTRYKLGTEWSPWKGHSFGASVMHDRERAIFAPSYRFMLAVDYTINLRKI